MTQKKPQAKQKPRDNAAIALQWTIWLLLGAMIVTLESKSALGAYHLQLDHTTGIQMAALSAICAVVAFIANAVAGAFKDDVRPHVRRRARSARAVSIAFLIVPICFLGSSLKWDSMQRAWLAYDGSAQMLADQSTVADPMADRYDRDLARQRLTRPTDPQLDPVNGEFWIALFLQSMLIFAADALRVPSQASKSETAYWRRKAADARRRFNAERREKEKREAERQAQRGNVAFPVFGKKRA